MRAIVKKVKVGKRTHGSTFVEPMQEYIGKTINVRPSGKDGFYNIENSKDWDWYFHKSWLKFIKEQK